MCARNYLQSQLPHFINLKIEKINKKFD